MKILFITALPLETNSSATIQNLALIKGFNELGHDVTLLTTKSSSDDRNYDDSFKDSIEIKDKYEIPLSLVYSNLRNKNKSNLFSKIKGVLRKPIGWIYSRVEIYDGFKTCIKNLREVKFDNTVYDVVISTSDSKSSHIIAEKFIEMYPNKCKRWIQYWGDPLYLDVTKKAFFRKRLYMEEKRIIGGADEIIYVSPMTFSKQKEIFSEYSIKMKFVPLSYSNERKNTNYNYNKENINIGYFGYYYSSARNILPLYKSAISGDFNLLIVGEGDVDLKSKSNIRVLPRMGYKEVQELEDQVDILTCVCNSSSTQIPGKLYYYAATYKPILIILDGNKEELKEYLKCFNRFVFCDNNIDDIKKTIEDIKLGMYKWLNKPCEMLYCKNISRLVLDSSEKFNLNSIEV